MVKDKDFLFITHQQSFSPVITRHTLSIITRHTEKDGTIVHHHKVFDPNRWGGKNPKKQNSHVSRCVQGLFEDTAPFWTAGCYLPGQKNRLCNALGSTRGAAKPQAPVCLSRIERLYASMCRQAGGTSHRQRQRGALMYQTLIRRTFF